jgi:hypothetical protein
MKPSWKPPYVKAFTFLMAAKMAPAVPVKAKYSRAKSVMANIVKVL